MPEARPLTVPRALPRFRVQPLRVHALHAQAVLVRRLRALPEPPALPSARRVASELLTEFLAVA
ncbi:hypothetical protein ACFL5O_05715 [Myxococcota bacterium]